MSLLLPQPTPKPRRYEPLVHDIAPTVSITAEELAHWQGQLAANGIATIDHYTVRGFRYDSGLPMVALISTLKALGFNPRKFSLSKLCKTLGIRSPHYARQDGPYGKPGLILVSIAGLAKIVSSLNAQADAEKMAEAA